MNIADWKYTIMSQIETIVIKIQNDNIFHYNISMTQIGIFSLFEAQLTTVRGV